MIVGTFLSFQYTNNNNNNNNKRKKENKMT